MVVPLRPMVVDVRGVGVHAPVLTLVDRRAARPRQKEWLMCRSAEMILHGPNEVRGPLALATLATLATHYPPFCPRSERRAPSASSCAATPLTTPSSPRSGRR